MKQILICFVLCNIFVCAKSQSAEKIIKTYFSGYEKKDWDVITSQLSEDFTFTSPNGDDHLTLVKYKEKCWAYALKFFKTIEFSKIVQDGNSAFAMYDITTTDNKLVHNVEYYTFSNGKIKSIETFFGAGVGYPGNFNKLK